MPFPKSLWYEGLGTFWISVEHRRERSEFTMEQQDVTLASWVQKRASSQFEILMFKARGISIKEADRAEKTLETIINNRSQSQDDNEAAEKEVWEQMKKIINDIAQSTRSTEAERKRRAEKDNQEHRSDCIVAKKASDELNEAFKKGEEKVDIEIVTVMQRMKVTIRRKKESKTGQLKWTEADEIINQWQMGILLGPAVQGQYRVLLADGNTISGDNESETGANANAEDPEARFGPRIAYVPAPNVISANTKWKDVSELFLELLKEKDERKLSTRNEACCCWCWPDFANVGLGLQVFGYLWPGVMLSYCLRHHYETGGRMQDEFVANLLLFAAIVVFTPCYLIYACLQPRKRNRIHVQTAEP